MDIKPGAKVTIKIVSQPRREAARKTLLRVCGKDPEMARVSRRTYEDRPSVEYWRRGGKMWRHAMKSKSPVKLEPGRSYTVRATMDVIRDLESVGNCVAVSNA